jgi:CBS domain-containing protein
MAETLRRLSVRSCRVVGTNGEVQTHHSVQCPREEASAAFERCCGCPHMKTVEVDPDGRSGSIECLAEGEPPRRRPRVDVAEAAIRVRLGDVLAIESTCIRKDVRVRAAAELLTTQGLGSAPVVDEGRRLVGVVSKADLFKSTSSRRGPLTVADVMTKGAPALPDDAPVAHAISAMAFARVPEVPVVDGNGQVLGMVTAIEALLWVAQALGYVADPAPPQT